MRIPGFTDRSRTTTTRVDPLGGDTVRTHETIRPAATTVHHEGVVRHETVRDHGDAHAPTGAYAAGITLQDLQRETHDAYKRGRRDERADRVGHPILTILVVLLAILGLALGVLALRERSFQGAGRVFDGWVGFAAEDAREVGRQAQDVAGEAAQDTGAALQSAGESAERTAEEGAR